MLGFLKKGAITTYPDRPPIAAAALDDTPLKVERREELPAGNLPFELVIFCKKRGVGAKQTHIKRPFTTCQNFEVATFKKIQSLYCQSPDEASKLYARLSAATTEGSRKLTILKLADEK